MRKRPVIFERFPNLEGAIPWISLGEFPTPIPKLEKLGAAIGLSQLYCKRDDLSHPEYGGNKIRKLEFLLADAVRLKRKSVFTIGAWGSNHILATTILSRKLGLQPIAIMVPQCGQEYARNNLLANFTLSCELNYAAGTLSAGCKIIEVYLRHWRQGSRPYFIWAGGSTPLGTLGYVNAGLEIADQVKEGLLPEPDYIFCAVGSCGTFAGLVIGMKLAGLKTRIFGVRVYDKIGANTYQAFRLAGKALRLLRKADPTVPVLRLSRSDFPVLHDYAGPGYAVSTVAGKDAVQMGKDLEGLQLDTTYTGKSLAGLIDLARKDGLNNKVVVFLNSFNSRDLAKLAPAFRPYRELPEQFRACFEGKDGRSE